MTAAPLSRFLRPLDELFHAPPLVAGERARLDDDHPVTLAVLVLLVVRLELGPLGQVLAVLAVRDPPLDQHDAGLVHLVAGDDTNELAPARLGAAGFGVALRFGLG